MTATGFDVHGEPLVIKGDVQGSVEAIVTALHNISNEDIKVRVLHAGVGAITAPPTRSEMSSKRPLPRFRKSSAPTTTCATALWKRAGRSPRAARRRY